METQTKTNTRRMHAESAILKPADIVVNYHDLDGFPQGFYEGRNKNVAVIKTDRSDSPIKIYRTISEMLDNVYMSPIFRQISDAYCYLGKRVQGVGVDFGQNAISPLIALTGDPSRVHVIGCGCEWGLCKEIARTTGVSLKLEGYCDKAREYFEGLPKEILDQ